MPFVPGREKVEAGFLVVWMTFHFLGGVLLRFL